MSRDKNEALWSQQKVNSIELLSQNDDKFVVLLGSTYNDSYIVEFEVSRFVPPPGYYTDYRDKHDDVSDQDFRDQLYDELRQACTIINTEKNKKTDEEQQPKDEVETVDFAGQKVQINRTKLDMLDRENVAQFSESRIISSLLANQSEKLSEMDHLVSTVIGVLPSMAGVTDSCAIQRKHNEYVVNQVACLHYAGAISKYQQQITVSDAQLIQKKFTEQVNEISLINEDCGQNEVYLLMQKKQAAEVLKINTKTLSVSDKNSLSDINANHNVLLADKCGSDLVIVTQQDIRFYKNFGKKSDTTTFKGVCLCASLLGSTLACCFSQVIRLYSVDGKVRQVQEISSDKLTGVSSQLTSVQLFVPQYRLERAFGHAAGEAGQSQGYLVIVNNDDQVFVSGLDGELVPHVIGCFTNIVRNQTVGDNEPEFKMAEQIDTCESPNQLIWGRSTVKGFNVSQVEFYDGGNLYMFLSVKGGGVYVYQLVRSWAEGQRPYFQLVQNMTQYLLAVADDENRFAILYKENKHEYRLL